MPTKFRIPAAAFVLALLVIYGVFKLFDVLLPFLIAFLVAYVSNPLVNWFQSRGFRREVAVILIYGAVALVVSVLADPLRRVLESDMKRLQTQAPLDVTQAKHMISVFRDRLSARLPFGGSLLESWSAVLYAPLIRRVQSVPKYFLAMLPIITYVFLVPVLSFYFLMDAPRAQGRLIQLCPSHYVEQLLHLLDEVDVIVGKYLKGVMLEACVVALLLATGLRFLGVHYFVAIAALAGVGCLVPYLGVLVSMGFGVLVAAFQFQSVWAGIKVAVLFASVKVADDVFLSPLLPSTSLHPVVFLLSLMIGGKLFGFGGLLLAIPIVSIARSLVKIMWLWYVSSAGLGTVAVTSALRVPYT